LIDIPALFSRFWQLGGKGNSMEPAVVGLIFRLCLAGFRAVSLFTTIGGSTFQWVFSSLTIFLACARTESWSTPSTNTEKASSPVISISLSPAAVLHREEFGHGSPAAYLFPSME
jgi:hypothetical protein